MIKLKMSSTKAEVLSIVFTQFGSYYSLFTSVICDGNVVEIKHAVPRNSLDNGLYSSPRRVVVNGSFVVEYLPKGLIIEVRPAPTQSQ